ncbi:DUF6300 family protein [Kitasatospora sp. NPDC048545]|uniref:DUF6300 family protein n=1 Tax=Kitasatospora sp. NPDC048545 TaxID=3157208 RepID=UPI0033C2C1A2
MADFQVIRTNDMPTCPQCGQAAALTARLPLGDGIDMLLCLQCDTGNTPAGRLVAILGLPEGERPMDLFGDFIVDWLHAGAAAHGWRQIPNQSSGS